MHGNVLEGINLEEEKDTVENEKLPIFTV